MTAKGLNGIEAEANKLAKAPKGIDGVTEGAGNLAEDVVIFCAPAPAPDVYKRQI